MKNEISNIQIVDNGGPLAVYEVNGEQHCSEIQEGQDGSLYFINYFEDGSHKVVSIDLKEVDEQQYYSQLEFKAGDL